jgi:CTP synthase
VRVNLRWVRAEDVEREDPAILMEGVDAILVPYGFGERGIEGKIRTIQYAREQKIPFFGVCLGLQLSVVEFARNVCGLKNANSTEFKRTRYNVIDMMLEQKNVKEKGGTMRLGAYPCEIHKGTKAYKAYKKELIYERHRHRYEVNNKFKKMLADCGMTFSGICPQNNLVEIIELPDHPWFVAGQFHPELKSRALHAHPLFRDFVKAAVEYQKNGKLKKGK